MGLLVADMFLPSKGRSRRKTLMPGTLYRSTSAARVQSRRTAARVVWRCSNRRGRLVRDTALTLARFVNPDCKFTGVSVNTSALSGSKAFEVLEEIEQQLNLPAVDSFRRGADRSVDALP